MNTLSFNKTKLLFDVCNYITSKKDSLLGDFVTYHDDPVRYMRRARLISQLATYEASIVTKIYNFQTEDLSDIDSTFAMIKLEVDTVASLSS